LSDDVAGGWWLAYKENNTWSIVDFGNGIINCFYKNQYIFSDDMLSDCYDSTIDWKTYRNDAYGFEFRYPVDWKYGVESAGQYSSSGEGDFIGLCRIAFCQDNSIFIIIHVQTTINDIINEFTADNAGADLTITNDNFLGYDAKIAAYTHKLGDGMWKEIAFEKGEIIFHLVEKTKSASSEDAIFDQVLSTFKFIK